MPLMPAENNDPAQSEKAVRDYYDDNTNLFLKLGAGGVTRAIHQPLFMKGDETIEDALHTQHQLILEIVNSNGTSAPDQILDLGCGVGSAIQYLAPRLKETEFTGITLSPKQAVAGEKWLRTNSFDNATIICGSFQELPQSVQPAGLAYAIESFIHATEAQLFFSEISRNLLPDGKLVIFDDVLDSAGATNDETLQAFISGWKANSLFSIPEIEAMALDAGLSLQESRDLSSYQHIWRPRDRWVSAIQPFLPILPLSKEYKKFLVGGNARQHLFRTGKLRYTMLVFHKSSVA